jgi:hypothetical protein
LLNTRVPECQARSLGSLVLGAIHGSVRAKVFLRHVDDPTGHISREIDEIPRALPKVIFSEKPCLTKKALWQLRHANASLGGVSDTAPSTSSIAPLVGTARQFTAEQIRQLVAALEVPFDPSQIDWRITNTNKNSGHRRGQVVPYADQRAYTDRLNLLVTPAGWTRKYAIHTSANFQRDKDQRVVAKVLVACELTSFGLGSHSATGEEWADDDNAVTSAEAQAFKRACTCFGLGRYL